MLAVATSAERCINIYSLPIRDQKLDGRFQQHGDMWDEVIHFHYFHCQYHFPEPVQKAPGNFPDRKSTRLNSSHVAISYAVFCLKKKKNPARLGRDTHKTRHILTLTQTRTSAP